jgi:hypothetical protein
MMRRMLVAALVLLAPMVARAEATGEIDWQHRTIKARGQGAPDLNAPSISSARLGAERAAKADALRNLLETLKGVQLTSGQKLGSVLASDNALRGQVEGTLRGFKVIAPHYYSDGGVALEVEVSLDALPKDLLARLPSGPGTKVSNAGTAGPANLPAPKDEPTKTPDQAVQPEPVDPARNVLMARGQGVPDPTAASTAVARIGAERAARLDALRVLTSAIKAGSARAGQLIEADANLASRVDGAVRGYKVSAVHYYSDGGVALDVELAIDQLPAELRASLQGATK